MSTGKLSPVLIEIVRNGVIAVTEETFADQTQTTRSEAMPASFLFADEVYKRWGARPFYLDAAAIRALVGYYHFGSASGRRWRQPFCQRCRR